MKEIKINGEIQRINVIRHFIKEEKEFLIFSFNEIQDGDIEVCMSVIENNIGRNLSEEEWEKGKPLIKEIAENNFLKKPQSITDVNNEVSLESYKKFLLPKKNVDLLFTKEEEKSNVEKEQMPSEVNNEESSIINKPSEEKKEPIFTVKKEDNLELSTSLGDDDLVNMDVLQKKYVELEDKYKAILKEYNDLLSKYILKD